MPEIIGLIATLVVVLFIMYWLRRKPSSDDIVEVDLDLGWLQERWKMADAAEKTGGNKMFRDWYFDPPTDRQLDRLEDLNVVVEGIALNKGKASDLIGMYEDPEDRQIAVLEFFKRPYRDLNQTQARHLADKLLSDPDNALKWEEWLSNNKDY